MCYSFALGDQPITCFKNPEEKIFRTHGQKRENVTLIFNFPINISF